MYKNRRVYRVTTPAYAIGLVVLILVGSSCQKQSPTSQPTTGPVKASDDGADPQVATKGSIEVTAQLTEIRYWKEKDTDFPPNDLYDYAYIMKYRVLKNHRGKTEGDTIFVGHYNPRKLRNAVADERVKDIGGNLKSYKAGDTHRMALEVPIDDHYMGPMLNKYHGEIKGPIYWAVWTNRVAK